MENYTKHLTSTQKGAIAENIVANDVMIETEGRLSPFSPIADDEGIDFLIYDKLTGKSIPIQIKSRTGGIVRNSRETNTIHFEIRNVSIKNAKYAYFLAILLDKDLHSVERAWFIPMKEIPNVLNRKNRQAKHIMRANRSLNTKDKYSKYQYKNMVEVVGRMVKIFEGN